MRTTLKAAIATIGCMCAVGMVCVAATDAKTGKRKSTPEEIAERKARFIQRTGGFVRKPGSGSGKVAIINSQNRFSNEDLKPVAIAVDKLMRLDCAVVRAENVGLSEAGKAVKSTGAAAGVVVAALEASLPPLILFPDQMCAVVNVGAFPKNANAVLLRKEALNNSIVQLASGVVLFLGSMVMMFVTDYIMAFTAIGASIIGFTVMMLIVSRSQKYFVRLQNSLGDMNGHIEEMYFGHVVVKAYNGEKASKKTFSKYNRKLYENAWRSQFMSGLMMPLMGFVGNLGYVAVCVVGAVLTMNGKIGFGVIVEFMIYVRLFTQPLSSIAQAMSSLQSTAAAGERVFAFLDEQELSDESAKTTKLLTARGDVQFENVSFGYNADRTIIRDFSAHAKPGQKIAIVGPTGAGKTTLVNLLMRFYEVNAGQICIDGVPVSELTRENVHDLFGMVLQDTWLFEGTIRENIVYSKQGVTDEDVVKACKAVGLHHFIKTLPQGYDTVLGG